jgi:cytochrome d ubiquinol oxidase subunit II
MIMETIWFALWGVLWGVYFWLDGFDLGLGSLMPVLAKSEADKKVIYNSMGPFWDGNEVWLLTAGGVTFAAFPTTYAVMFSSLYTPLLIILFALILRGVSFELRSHFESDRMKALWDACLVVGSLLPALLFGVAFANIFAGLPIDRMGDQLMMRGGLLTLINWYGLLGGVLFLLLFWVHGSIWLAIKTEGELQARAAKTARCLWVALVLVAVAFLVATWFATDLWSNYLSFFPLLIVPLICVAALLSVGWLMVQGKWWPAWFASGLTIFTATAFGVIGLYPNMIPSTISPEYSLTAFNSASSPLTLTIMLVVALIFVPIVLLYQLWAYRTFRDKVTPDKIAEEGWY